MKVLTGCEFELFLGLVRVGTRKDIAVRLYSGRFAVIIVTTIFASVCDHVDTIVIVMHAPVVAIRPVF